MPYDRQTEDVLRFDYTERLLVNEGFVKLRPFGDGEQKVELLGRLQREGKGLLLEFIIEGKLDQVILPNISFPAKRADGLWNRSCFEVFIAKGSSPGYFEFNMAPNSDWNLYLFSDYRSGMIAAETLAPSTLIKRSAQTFCLTTEFSLPGTFLEGPLLCGLSAVIEHFDGNCSYFALKHAREKPDFHARESFIIQI